MRYVDLYGLDLVSFKIKGSNLGNADLRNTRLSNIKPFGEKTVQNKMIMQNFPKDLQLSIDNICDIRGKVFAFKNSTFDMVRMEVLKSREILLTFELKSLELIDVNFNESDLTGAYLTGSDLSRSNLSGADLTKADLAGANFRGANLAGAKFQHAILSDETIGSIIWDEQTNWEGVIGLDQAIGVPDELKQQLGLDRP